MGEILSIDVGTNYQLFSILERSIEPSNSENMYALGLPISVHSTALDGPNMSIPVWVPWELDSVQFLVGRLLGSGSQRVVRKVMILSMLQ